MPRSVLLLVNRNKPEVVAALDEVRTLITQNGHGRIAAELDADSQPLTAEHAKDADLIVVLGGDGTLMAQSRRCVALGLPMLGVNLGKLGFMAEFDLASLRTYSPRLFDGSALQIQDRPMLRVTVQHPTSPPHHPPPHNGGAAKSHSHGLHHAALAPGEVEPVLSRTLALNDAVVTAGPPYRMVSIAIRIDGHDGPTVTGDGLIVSTAIGSTAYNASAGGPIISPEVPAMAITAIAPHTLSFRPVVVNLSSTVELTMVRANDGSEATMGAMAELASVATGTALVLDGQVPVRLRTGDKVIIRQHAKPARFVRNPGRSYWQTLLTKMRWAAPPAIRTR